MLQKNPVTYLVREDCHLEYLLHTTVEDMEPDLSDDLPELTSAQAEPKAIDTANES